MQPHQTRIRRMRPAGRHPGRSTNGTRRNYHVPDVVTVTRPDEAGPEIILVTDPDGNLTEAYIAYTENEGQEATS